MALSATISVNNSSIVVGQVVRAFITVSSTNPNATSIAYIIPQITQTGNGAPVDRSSYGAGPVAQPGNIPVPAGGSEVFTMDVAFYTPSLILDGAIQTSYSVGCLISDVNGNLVTPTPATVSVVGVNPYL
jgi:hypothetical protein